MSEALEGVVVVDFSHEFWSSLAAALLGDFGARVIRVDDSSTAPRDPDRDGLHPVEAFDYEAQLIHRNKESIGLDLAADEGRGLLHQLIGCADVFLTDASVEQRKSLEIDADTICEAWPELIYAGGSGFGPRGKDASQVAYDELAAARSGVMYSLPQPDQPPINAAAGQMYTTVMLALGVVTALRHRNESGRGQRVDASLLGGHMYASTLTLDAFMAMREDRLGEPRSRFEAANPMSGISYPSQDGRWVTLTMPDTDRWWPAFSEVVGMDLADPRFDSHEKRCGESRLEMMHALEEIFATRPASHWRAEFDERKLSADIIEQYDYPATDPNARKNGYIMEIDHPKHGRFQSLGFPIWMSDTPARIRQLAPEVGQHTDSILKGLLGLTSEEVAGLKGQSVVAANGATKG